MNDLAIFEGRRFRTRHDVRLSAVSADGAELLREVRARCGTPCALPLDALVEDLRRNRPENLYRARGARFRWLVLRDGRPVGWISLKVDVWWRRRGELACGLAPELRGRGLMRRALGLLIDELFAHTQLDTLVARCAPDDRAGLRLQEALGFRRGGEPPRLGADGRALGVLTRPGATEWE
jgi:GNAT superfamily N-acetyltransferase